MVIGSTCTFKVLEKLIKVFRNFPLSSKSLFRFTHVNIFVLTQESIPAGNFHGFGICFSNN